MSMDNFGALLQYPKVNVMVGTEKTCAGNK